MSSRPWKVYLNDAPWTERGEATRSFTTEERAVAFAVSFVSDGSGQPKHRELIGDEAIVAGPSSSLTDARRTVYRRDAQPEVQMIDASQFLFHDRIVWMAA